METNPFPYRIRNDTVSIHYTQYPWEYQLMQARTATIVIKPRLPSERGAMGIGADVGATPRMPDHLDSLPVLSHSWRCVEIDAGLAAE